MRAIRGFVGIPFLDRGRAFDGADCYGVGWLVFLRAAGIELPSYDWISSADAIAIARAMDGEVASQRWRPLGEGETVRPFDMAAMIEVPKPGARAWHCGVAVASDTLLHTERGTGSHLVAIKDPTIAPRITGWFRNVELEARDG